MVFDFDCDVAEYLDSLGELQHRPIDGPRLSHVGENVFAYQWEKMMLTRIDLEAPPNGRLALILWDMTREITQRHASVAASFITWLGCNAGSALIENAKRLYMDIDSPHRLTREQATLARWSLENLRSPGKTFRLIDHILASADDYGPDLFSNGIGLRRMPKVSVEDVETCDHIAYWCGSPDGCEFIRLCNAQIRARERVSVTDSIKIIAGVQP